MHPNALLDLATELLRNVLKFDAPADSVVSSFFRSHRALGARERHALAETVYHVLRRRAMLQHLAQSGTGALERRLAILGWQGGDGLLRGALGPREQDWRRQVGAIDPAGFSEKLRHNLPEWLAHALRTELGDEEFWALVRALEVPAPLDLRVNTLKARREDTAPARILRLEAGSLKPGETPVAQVCVIDPEVAWQFDVNKTFSKGKNSPFQGMPLKGKVVLTICGNEIYRDARFDARRLAGVG